MTGEALRESSLSRSIILFVGEVKSDGSAISNGASSLSIRGNYFYPSKFWLFPIRVMFYNPSSCTMIVLSFENNQTQNGPVIFLFFV